MNAEATTEKQKAETCKANGRCGSHRGVVKWFNKGLGYGFIQIPPALKFELGIATEADLYVHAADIIMPFPKSLGEGQRVKFGVERAERGWRAINVEVLR